MPGSGPASEPTQQMSPPSDCRSRRGRWLARFRMDPRTSPGLLPNNHRLPASSSPPHAQPPPASPSTAVTQPPAVVASRMDRAGTVAIITSTGVVLAALITGSFGRAHDDKPQPPPPASVEILPPGSAFVFLDCPTLQQEVVDFVKQNPGVIPSYGGPADQQCHLNTTATQALRKHRSRTRR
jgi:hypothetical protein